MTIVEKLGIDAVETAIQHVPVEAVDVHLIQQVVSDRANVIQL